MACCLLLLGACGYVGDTLPPALYIPLPVADLSAMQEGAVIVTRFTLPTRSTEDLPLERIPEVDLRGAVWENRPWDEIAWEREAQRLPVELADDAASARTPVNGFVDRRVLLRVRVAGQKGRFSAWSEPAALRVLPPQLAPGEIVVTAAAQGVMVAWTVASSPDSNTGKLVEIWRRQGAESEFRMVGTAKQSPYLDEGAIFGEPHSYRLRTRVDGEEKLAISQFTHSVSLIPVDTFAPAIPVDLMAIAGSARVELSWSRNAETDLAGYRVYRATGDGDFVLVSSLVAGSSFSDATAPVGMLLRYRITAVDTLDNESAACEPVDLVLP